MNATAGSAWGSRFAASTSRRPFSAKAGSIELSDGQLERLSNLTPASGERHDETNMAAIDR